MALPTTAPESNPSPLVVGRAFVEQYYLVFQESPESVFKFYEDSSILSRPDVNGLMASVTTMQAINNLVLSLDSKNYITEIETVDSQPSYQDGVFILVTGCLTGSDGIRRKFAQTFFLARRGKGLYVVLNDVFRYMDEGQSADTSQIFVNGVNEEAIKASLTLDHEPGLPQGHHVVEAAQDHHVVEPVQGHHVVEPASQLSDVEPESGEQGHDSPVIGASVPEVIVTDEPANSTPEVIVTDEPANSSQVETPVVSERAPVAPVTAPTVANEDVSKKSYASIVKVMKGSAPQGSIYVPATKAKPAVAPPDKPPAAAVKPAVSQKPVVAAPVPQPEMPATSSNENENVPDVEGHSIYIRNLPMNATPPQVEEVFKKFGSIKPGGVQVRNHKIDRHCFGFVEFESLSSMQAAIEASPIIINGCQATAEEKRTTTRVINGVVSLGNGGGRGWFPMGRGGGIGFRNDNFRGRGAFAHNNNHGYARGDFRNRGEYQMRNDYYNRGGGEYGAANRGRGGQGGRPSGETTAYQQRPLQNGNSNARMGNRPNGVASQIAVSA